MSPTLVFVRYVLPAAIVITAVVAVAVSESSYRALEGGAMLAGVGLSVYLLNALHRMGASGDADRDREEAARRYFDEHGDWPDHARLTAPARRPARRVRRPSSPARRSRASGG